MILLNNAIFLIWNNKIERVSQVCTQFKKTKGKEAGYLTEGGGHLGQFCSKIRINGIQWNTILLSKHWFYLLFGALGCNKSRNTV